MRRGRRLLVTGGSGFLGRHVVRHALDRRWTVFAPSSGTLDLRDEAAVRAAFREFTPHAVVHTAYRRHDRASIVDATLHVAEAAASTGARMVHVSSDALFAGRPEPYVEEDDPSPVHEYGRAKAVAEAIVEAGLDDAAIVRTSLLYGTGELSSHEIAVRDAVEGSRPMTFFTDEYRSPLVVDDLAAGLAELAERTDVRGRLHLAGPDRFSRAELAIATARRHGWNVDRLRCSTIAEAGLVRPGCVVLDSSRAASIGLVTRAPFA
ncbi:MAG: SDR family oxidoreductase [Ilumatobacter sp.]|nr:SDR family oxidoreductase [Ilumatobacter sp.]